MPSQIDDSNQEPYYIFTDEDRLIIEALEADLSNPEPLVKLLLILYDHIKEARLQDSIYLLMKAAFKYSIIHSIAFHSYLEAIRKGQNPAEEARAREYGDHNSEA